MTLSFSTHVGGEPTYFVERVWASIPYDKLKAFFYKQYNIDFTDNEAVGNFIFEKCGHVIQWRRYYEFKSKGLEKPHTIREDKPKRWKVGTKIHFVIFNRTPRRFQFAPTLEVTSVEGIQIRHLENPAPIIESSWYLSTKIMICGNHIGANAIKQLAVKDGFNSYVEFLKWFNQDFDGVIIHWQDLRYCP